MEEKIGIIGFGNMGSVIAHQLKATYKIRVFDKDKNRAINVEGINVALDNADLVKSVDIVILAVKPQDLDAVLAEISNFAAAKLIISIAASIPTFYIEKRLNQARVIRVMPNLPVWVGKGMTCICRGLSATDEDLNLVRRIFDDLGKTMILKEGMMNAATVISGSGPGYLYDWVGEKNVGEIKKYTEDTFTPELIKAAMGIGFNAEEARLLVETTVEGSIAFLEITGISPLQLKEQIASKGGTTEAALEILHTGGSLQEAVKAALRRAGELSVPRCSQ